MENITKRFGKVVANNAINMELREALPLSYMGLIVSYLNGAGEGNRTLTVSLEGFCSTIELHPHLLSLLQYKIGFWWREKDSNLRSLRNRFTVCPLWPLGNPSKRETQ